MNPLATITQAIASGRASVGGTVLRNAGAVLVIQGANLLLPLVTYPYLIRTLGLERFGAFAFTQAVISYFTILADYGFNYSGTRRVAEQRAAGRGISETFWSVQAAKALLALAGGAVLVAAAALVPQLRAERTLLLAWFPMVLGALLYPQWLLQGVERMWLAAAALTGARAASVALTLVLVRSPSDAWLAALLQACAPAAAGAVVGVAVWRAGLVAWRRPTAAAVRAALREGRHVFASTAAITLYTATNTVVLGFVAGNASVAIFAAADRIRLTLQGALTPLASAAYPRVSALMGTDRPAAFRLVRTLLVLQAGGMFVASAAAFALAPWIAALFMGQATGPAVLVLRLMSVLPFVISFSNVLGVQAMLPMGLDAQFSRIVTVCGLVNVVLLLSLGAAFREVGAAVAVLVTETLVSLAMALALRAQLAGRGALARST